jgi:thiol-disulfide isomerase/thioredoxin
MKFKIMRHIRLTITIAEFPFIVIFLLILTSCGKSHRILPDKLAFVPQVQYDTAILSGKISGAISDDQKVHLIELGIIKVVTGDNSISEIPVKTDGSFTFKIPVQSTCPATIIFKNSRVILCLIPGEETEIELGYDKDQLKPIQITNSIGFTAEDAIILLNWPWELSNIGNEVITPEEFSKRVINGIPEVLKPVDNNTRFSKSAKQILTAEIKFACIYHQLFNYNSYIKKAYLTKYKTDSLPKEFQVVDKSYFSFLRYFNLNDPSNLTSSFYPYIIQSLLGNEILSIPAIGDKPVDKWLIKVKEILKGDIGSNTGLFYDLLVSNSYAKQLNAKTPLTEIQIENIKSYFTNPSFIKILTYKNDEVLKLTATSKTRKISVSSPGNVMDSIISKYNGKVIFVDFWATWCGPCQLALKRSESLRKDFEKEDVAFVYVTDPSSPRYIWEQQIPEIGGDHYYVTENEWNYLNKIYGFTAIPHYLIFDKSGRLKYNYHTFMGVDSMRKWIEKTLTIN